MFSVNLHKKLLFSLFALLLVACGDKEPEEIRTWFGGEIINPEADFVVLAKNSVIIDTIALDRNNFFNYEFDTIEPGLYSFIHREYQLFYIEPGDSIMLRVNTVEFDESLAYTGKGAEKNNFLINMFLHNEKENKYMPKFYQKSAQEFSASVDSMQAVRENMLAKFNQKNNTCDRFNEIAQASINYDNYAKKELYPFAHYGSNHVENITSLPTNFYDYRSSVDYGNGNLYTYYPYYRYLTMYLDNVTYTTYMNRARFDRNSWIHSKTKIELIDSIITHDSLKNNLMYAAAERFLIHSKDSVHNSEIAALFTAKNNSNNHTQDLNELLNTCNNMVPGQPLPNQVIATSSSTLKDLRSAINKPTVLFFWSSESSRHNTRIHLKAAEMKEKYPEFEFIGICVGENHKKWLKLLEKRKFNPDTEFRFNDSDLAKKQLVINNLNKAVIVDKNGVILENNTNLASSRFELELLGILNQ